MLSGERFVARFDLKADHKRGTLRVLSCRFEGTGDSRPAEAADGEAARSVLTRYADALGLTPTGWRLAEAVRAMSAAARHFGTETGFGSCCIRVA